MPTAAAKRDANKTRLQLADEIAGGSRRVFQSLLADAIQAKPSKAAIRRHARDKPHLWAQSLTHLARLSGYTDAPSIPERTQAVTVAEELLNRYGRDRARTMLEAAGLPVELLPNERHTAVAVVHEPASDGTEPE